ncbi:MAG: hypothetical protein ACRCST_17990 [Turicibacter sp.]
MKKLYIQYSYTNELWGVFDPDVDDFIYLHELIDNVVNFAYNLAALIRPAKVLLIPQYMLSEYTLCSCL